MDEGLFALSPYDGRYRSIGQELAPWFSEAGIIKTRIALELSYLTLLSRKKIIRPFTRIETSFIKKFNPGASQIKEIEKRTHHDVQAAVVYLQTILSKSSLADISDFVHFGLTSEDINNITWRTSLMKARESVLIPSLEKLVGVFGELAKKYKSLVMLGRTHGQPAVPTTFGKEMINVAIRLHGQKNKLIHFQFQGKLNGAVGNFHSIDRIVSDTFITTLGFLPHHFTTQVNPNDDVIEYLQIIERINNILHGFSQDMWRYISDEWVLQKPLGVGSSTMPQKINPIDFEHSEGATEIANGLIGVLVERLGESRLQRDLSDTPLFRFLGEIHAATIDALGRTTSGLGRIEPNKKVMQEMLEKNWAILAEPLQLLLKKSHKKDAYEKVKKLTQGKTFTRKSWEEMVHSILGKHEPLTPNTYIGKARELTEEGLRLLQK